MSWISWITPLIFTAVLAVALATEWAMRKHGYGALEKARADALDRITARLIGDDNNLRYRKAGRRSSYPLDPGLDPGLEYGDRGRAMLQGGYKYHYFQHQWMSPTLAKDVDPQVVTDNLSYHLWKLEEGPTYVAGIAASLVAVAVTVAVNLAHVPEDDPWVYVFTYVVPFFFITVPLVLYLMRLREKSYWKTLIRAAGPEYELVKLKRELAALNKENSAAIVDKELKKVRREKEVTSAEVVPRAVAAVKKALSTEEGANDDAANVAVDLFEQRARRLASFRERIEAAMADELRAKAEDHAERAADRAEREARKAVAARASAMVRQRMSQQKVAKADALRAEFAATKLGALFRGRQARAEVVEERAREAERDLQEAAAAATSARAGATGALEEALARANAIQHDLRVAATEAAAMAGEDEAAAMAKADSALIAHKSLKAATAAAKKAKTAALLNMGVDEVARLKQRLSDLQHHLIREADPLDVKKLQAEKKKIKYSLLPEKQTEVARLRGAMMSY